MATREPRGRRRERTHVPAGEPQEIREPHPGERSTQEPYPGEPSTRRDVGGAAGARGWREEVVSAAGLNVLAGIWLVISPFALDYEGGDAYWNPIVLGAIVALIAIARAAGAYRQTWMSWLSAGIGVWLFASAFWLADSAAASWNVGIMGVIVFLLATWAASASAGRDRTGRRGGGAATIDRM